jgi:hypothetical protein
VIQRVSLDDITQVLPEVSEMGEVFTAVPEAMAAFSAANQAAAATIAGAGLADAQAMLSAAAGAIGPFGATYLAAYATAQANNLAATLQVAHVHAAIGGATEASSAAFVARDHA